MIDVEHLTFALVVIDRNRVITEVSEPAAVLVGSHAKDLIGQTIHQAMRPRTQSGRDLLADDWHPGAYIRGSRRFVEQEIVIRKSDDTELDVLVDGGYTRDDNGNLTGAEILLRPKSRGPRRPRSGVRIVSAVSHELRSPLTSVRGYTTLLLKNWDTVGDDDRKMMLQQIDRDARRISRMIGELLDIARIETGKVQLHRIEIDLSSIATEVVRKTFISYPELEAEVDFPIDFPLVWADGDKIEQVMINLVENACKYASPKGIVIRGTIEANNVVVSVSDHGHGIPTADLPNLFQQFFKSSEGRPTGTGLGLWISRGLIEAHKGELGADSQVGVGSTFRFTLPQRSFEEMHGRYPGDERKR